MEQERKTEHEKERREREEEKEEEKNEEKDEGVENKEEKGNEGGEKNEEENKEENEKTHKRDMQSSGETNEEAENINTHLVGHANDDIEGNEHYEEERIITQHFFGKSVKMNIPNTYLDISQFRIIPDNQEVYAHNTKNRSIIIEFLCHGNVSKEELGKIYFDDLACFNESVDNKILIYETDISHPQRKYILVVGEQKIKKVGFAEADNVQVFMGVFAYPQYNADILITWNYKKESDELEPQLTTFKNMIQSFQIVNFKLFV